ncbi:band-7 C-terminal domain-containing protein [Vibrio sp. PNB22_3_1]
MVDAASTPEGKIAVQFQLSAHAIDVHAQAAKESTVMILADESFNPASLVAQGMVVMNSVKSKASDSFNHLLIYSFTHFSGGGLAKRGPEISLLRS